MANNYVQFSEILEYPGDRHEDVLRIVDEQIEKLEQSSDVGICDVDVACRYEPADGYEVGSVWLYSEQDRNVEHAVAIAQAVMDGLNLPGTFVLNYAWTSDRLRIGEFGGGAVAVRAHKEPLWCYPEQQLLDQVSEESQGRRLVKLPYEGKLVLELPSGEQVSIQLSDLEDDALPELDIWFEQEVIANCWAAETKPADAVEGAPHARAVRQIIIPVRR